MLFFYACIFQHASAWIITSGFLPVWLDRALDQHKYGCMPAHSCAKRFDGKACRHHGMLVEIRLQC